MNPTQSPHLTLVAPVAAVAALAAVTLFAPIQANAAGSSTMSAPATSRLVHTDPAHDVLSSSLRDEKLRPAPKRADVDIRKVKARYEDDKVVLTMVTRKVMPSHDVALVSTLRTPSRNYELTYSRLFGERDLSLNRGARTVRCEGLRVRRDNAQRRFRVVVPASCIGTPKRVSVGLGAIAIKGERYFVDDAFSSRATDNLARSRWIRRG